MAKLDRVQRTMLAILAGLFALALVFVLFTAAVVEGVITEPTMRFQVARMMGRNFGVAVPGIYRGGQPNTITLPWLWKTQHFQTVVNLAWKDSEADIAEKAFFESQGVTYHHFSWSPEQAATTEEVDTALQLIEKSAKPVFVHCIAGMDRTGGLVGTLKLRAGATQKELDADWARFGTPSESWRNFLEQRVAIAR